MRWILTILITMILVSLVSAGTYQVNQQLDLTVSCSELNCSNINITILYPNSSVFVNNQQMTDNIYFVNYTLTPTANGNYVYYYADENSSLQGNFDVTPSGSLFTNALSIPLFLPMILMLLITVFFFLLMGFTKKQEYKLTFMILGGIFIIFSISFGIIASREVLFGFPLLYGFVNSFYKIFMVALRVGAIVVPIIVMFFVIKRAFDTRGYNIGGKK